MTTQYTPPQGGPARRGIGAVGVVTAVVGGIVLFGLGASVALMLMTSANRADAELRSVNHAPPVATEGVTQLTIAAGLADLDVVFADVPGATLDVRGAGADRWQLRRDGDELVVRAPKSTSGFCFFGLCPANRGQHAMATLTLPEALDDRGIDADITVGVGALTAAGNFGELSVSVDVGEATIRGQAATLDLGIGVGSFTGAFSGTTDVEAEVSLGELDLTLSGEPPTDVDLRVSAGSIALAVPGAAYDVRLERGIGDITNALPTDPASPHRITAKADLGEISLRATR